MRKLITKFMVINVGTNWEKENTPEKLKNFSKKNKNERKANYFAASMILGNVLDFYHESEGSFVEKVLRCMDAYKAPYKVVVKLYEYSYKNNNESLKKYV